MVIARASVDIIITARGTVRSLRIHLQQADVTQYHVSSILFDPHN